MRHFQTALVILSLSALAAFVGCDRDSQESEPAIDEREERASARSSEEERTRSDIPEDQAVRGLTEQESFFVEIIPQPNPIPFQELFELNVRIYDSEAANVSPPERELLTEVELDQVRATMPAHGHGMKTEPKITRRDDGSFRVEGMKFHMQGDGEDGLWRLQTVINGEGTIDQATFDVYCCR